MPLLNIAPVSLAGMRFLGLFYGLSETGKTLSALLVASGLEPDPAKRCLLDTEGGQRGRAYSDDIPGGYLYANLRPPFTPERYIEALNEIEQAGVTTLVVDSVSHAWFATGGILDIVDASTSTNGQDKWKDPKRRLGRVMNKVLQGDMHAILCARGKQPLVNVAPEGQKKELKPGPVIPIFEKGLRYDMTVIAHMLGDGRYTVAGPAGKCLGRYRPFFDGQEVMTQAIGQKIAAAVGDQAHSSPAARRVESEATEAADQGVVAFRAFYKALHRDDRAFIAGDLANYQSIAAAADLEVERRRREAADGDVPADPFEQPATDGVRPVGEDVA